MARTAKMAMALNAPRFRMRRHNRCGLCGRSRAYIRYFGVCRICFRHLALKGELPGVRKASW